MSQIVDLDAHLTEEQPFRTDVFDQSEKTAQKKTAKNLAERTDNKDGEKNRRKQLTYHNNTASKKTPPPGA